MKASTKSLWRTWNESNGTVFVLSTTAAGAARAVDEHNYAKAKNDIKGTDFHIGDVFVPVSKVELEEGVVLL